MSAQTKTKANVNWSRCQPVPLGSGSCIWAPDCYCSLPLYIHLSFLTACLTLTCLASWVRQKSQRQRSVYVPTHISMYVCYIASVVSDSLRLWTAAIRLLCPWDSPGKKTGVDCHNLLQRIFPTQGLNSHLLCLLHQQGDSLPLLPPGKPISMYTYTRKVCICVCVYVYTLTHNPILAIWDHFHNQGSKGKICWHIQIIVHTIAHFLSLLTLPPPVFYPFTQWCFKIKSYCSIFSRDEI